RHAVDPEPAPEHRAVRARRALTDANVAKRLGQRLPSRPGRRSNVGRAHGAPPSSLAERTLQRAAEGLAAARLAALVAAQAPALTFRRRAVRPGLGIDLALRLGLNAVVADGRRCIEPVGDVLAREVDDVPGRDRVPRPDARVAVRL